MLADLQVVVYPENFHQNLTVNTNNMLIPNFCKNRNCKNLRFIRLICVISVPFCSHWHTDDTDQTDLH